MMISNVEQGFSTTLIKFNHIAESGVKHQKSKIKSSSTNFHFSGHIR
jgi:hypothetical protein